MFCIISYSTYRKQLFSCGVGYKYKFTTGWLAAKVLRALCGSAEKCPTKFNWYKYSINLWALFLFWGQNCCFKPYILMPTTRCQTVVVEWYIGMGARWTKQLTAASLINHQLAVFPARTVNRVQQTAGSYSSLESFCLHNCVLQHSMIVSQ